MPWSLYALELRRLYQLFLRAAGVIFVVGALLEVFREARISFMMTMLTILLPIVGIVLLAALGMLLVIWPIPLTLGGVSVLRERINHTWELLLITPIPHGELLLIKLASGLTRMQSFLTATIVLQAVPLIGLLGLLTERTTVDHSGLESLAWAIATIGLFCFDRMQQAAFAGLLGLAASLRAENWGVAVSGAAAIGGAVWLIRTMLVFGLTLGIAGDAGVDAGQVFVIGIPALIVAVPSPRIGLLMAAVLVLIQELAIRRLSVWLIRHASG